MRNILVSILVIVGASAHAGQQFQTQIPELHKFRIQMALMQEADGRNVTPLPAETQVYLKAELAATKKCAAEKNCK